MLSFVFLLPISYIFDEIPELFHIHFFREKGFWTIMTIAGMTGFLINIAVFLQIKVTSPLTNTISGTSKVTISNHHLFKACAQTLLAWMIFRNEITPLNALGIFITLAGSLIYSYVRMNNL